MEDKKFFQTALVLVLVHLTDGCDSIGRLIYITQQETT